MRLSELAGKRLINLFDGEIIGSVGDCDLLLDGSSGDIEQILLPPPRRAQTNSRRRDDYFIRRHTDVACTAIPRSSIRKIGSQVVVVDVEY